MLHFKGVSYNLTLESPVLDLVHHFNELCSALCNPIVCSLPGFSVHGVFQARISEWVAISYSRGSFPLRDRPCVSWISCICRWILYHSIWEAPYTRLRPLDFFPPGLKWKTGKVDEFMLRKPSWKARAAMTSLKFIHQKWMKQKEKLPNHLITRIMMTDQLN